MRPDSSRPSSGRPDRVHLDGSGLIDSIRASGLVAHPPPRATGRATPPPDRSSLATQTKSRVVVDRRDSARRAIARDSARRTASRVRAASRARRPLAASPVARVARASDAGDRAASRGVARVAGGFLERSNRRANMARGASRDARARWAALERRGGGGWSSRDSRRRRRSRGRAGRGGNSWISRAFDRRARSNAARATTRGARRAGGGWVGGDDGFVRCRASGSRA